MISPRLVFSVLAVSFVHSVLNSSPFEAQPFLFTLNYEGAVRFSSELD
jgi:hypothetical protein